MKRFAIEREHSSNFKCYWTVNFNYFSFYNAYLFLTFTTGFYKLRVVTQ